MSLITRRLSHAVSKFSRRPSIEPTDNGRQLPSVEHLLKNRQEVMTRYQGSRIAKFRVGLAGGDTPVASLGRLLQFFIIGWSSQAAAEVRYFWSQGENPEWTLARLPDPQDPDPVRCGIMVVLVRLLCKDFNGLIRKGYPRGSSLEGPPTVPPESGVDALGDEVVPEWAEMFGRVSRDPKEWVHIPDARGYPVVGEAGLSEEFMQAGIVVREPRFRLKVD